MMPMGTSLRSDTQAGVDKLNTVENIDLVESCTVVQFLENPLILTALTGLSAHAGIST